MQTSILKKNAVNIYIDIGHVYYYRSSLKKMVEVNGEFVFVSKSLVINIETDMKTNRNFSVSYLGGNYEKINASRFFQNL